MVLLKRADNKNSYIKKLIKNIKTVNIELDKKDKIIKELKDDIKLMKDELTKKDNAMIELKDDIKKDIRFNENFLPESYLRISKRFPHLDLQEIISFDRKVRDNGGSIKVHSGIFTLLHRPCRIHGHSYCETFVKFMGWDCCPGNPDPIHRYRCCNNYREKRTFYSPHSSGLLSCNGDLYDRDPCTGNSSVFYLNEEDEKMKDIKNVTINDVSKSIEHNIKILKETIEKYSEKIKELTKLNETLNLLI